VAFGELGIIEPRPAILSLRVCKSPVGVGIDSITLQELKLQDEDFSLCKGKYAMATFLHPNI